MANTTESSFQVIHAYSTHVDLIAPLFNAYRMFYGRKSNLQRCTQFLHSRVGVRDTAIFFALEGKPPSEKALGFMILYPSFSSVLAHKIWILDDIYVIDKARRRGVAKALIERARRLVSDSGAKRLTLSTGIDNAVSHALYESLGFRRDEAFCCYFVDL